MTPTKCPDFHPSDIAALILRLGLGGMYLAHGLMALFASDGGNLVAFFDSRGLADGLANWVIWGEIGGGVLLIAGVMTRWVVLALIPLLLSAACMHFECGFLFNTLASGWEYPAFLLLASLAQSVLGGGAFAMPRLICQARALNTAENV